MRLKLARAMVQREEVVSNSPLHIWTTGSGTGFKYITIIHLAKQHAGHISAEMYRY
jgi:hypothetical protein